MDPHRLGNVTLATKRESLPLPKRAHLLCGWPLVLVCFGGAIGGGLGGAAYGINVMIYKSHLVPAAKVVLNLLTGLAAIGLWALIAGAIHSIHR
jgi:hypothetical protein